MERWSLRNAGRTLPRHFVVLAAVHGNLGLPGWRLFRVLTLLSPFSYSSSSLIGLLASVDVKQQNLTQRSDNNRASLKPTWRLDARRWHHSLPVPIAIHRTYCSHVKAPEVDPCLTSHPWHCRRPSGRWVAAECGVLRSSRLRGARAELRADRSGQGQRCRSRVQVAGSAAILPASVTWSLPGGPGPLLQVQQLFWLPAGQWILFWLFAR